MIRRLTLRNWRNYEDATVEFGIGTTFVVAPNGVGKTSLVEAARWALFGTIGSHGPAAIRVGTDSAVAIVELQLPDLRLLTVERTLATKPRSAQPSPLVHLDGKLMPPDKLDQQLIGAYGAEPGFLAGLTMPAVDRDRDKPSALGLEDHLGRYYGIDGLRNAIDQLKSRLKATDSRIRQIKTTNSASSQRLTQLQHEVEQATHHLDEAAKEHKAMQSRVDKAREQERLEAYVKKWQDRHSARAEAVERITVQVSSDLGRSVDFDSVERVLESRVADLDQQIETIRVEVAVIEAKSAALAANQARLDGAHDDCPVCRRPLDDTAVAWAHEANLQELSGIRDSILDLRTSETDLLAQRERVKAAQAEWRRIPQPGEPPQAPTADDEPASATELAAVAETAFNTLVEARASHVRVTREFDEARNAERSMLELESLFRQQASLRVAVEATESTLTELLDDTIRPLAAEVNQRWGPLFSGRGRVNTYSDGSITRTVNGHPLPYDSFSTGEGMSLTILLRLLVAQMATTVDFCWFDEPLEHLDPEVRRKVANVLSRATSTDGPLRQVVVTTYEEPLARHLQARDEQRVKLLHVRQAGS